MRKVIVQRRVLEANDTAASHLREHFAHRGTLVLNLISSPGSGKTTLLERTVEQLSPRLRLSAIEGDIETERDALRLRRLGIPARQILTGGACHLDARQVHDALHDDAALTDVDILFVENVGNLVCPTGYDLGEDFKVALLSTPEGDDKPFKYPAIFARAEVTVVTKVDLLPLVRFDLDAVRDQVLSLRPGAAFLTTSAVTGEGISAWCRLLEQRLAAKRAGA